MNVVVGAIASAEIKNLSMEGSFNHHITLPRQGC